MIEYKTVKVYEWEDIELAMSEAMGIDAEYFRNLHLVFPEANPEDDYWDAWHLMLECVIPNSMSNDSIQTLWRYENFIEDYEGIVDWKICVLDAWNQVARKIDPDDKGVYVNFSW